MSKEQGARRAARAAAVATVLNADCLLARWFELHALVRDTLTGDID